MIYDIVCGRGWNIYKRDKFNRICLVGGAQTFASYAKASRAQKLAHIDFLSNLQLYLEFAEFKNAQGRRLIASRSALGRMWALRNSHGDSAAEFRRHVLCGRGDFSQNEGVFNVYGHTPIASPDITEFSANIDTGCVYKHDFGRLCVLESEYAGFYAGKYRERWMILVKFEAKFD